MDQDGAPVGIPPPGPQPSFLATLQQIWLGWLGSQPPFRAPRSTSWASRTGSGVSRNRFWSSRRSRNVFSTPFGVILGWRSVRSVPKIDEKRVERVYFSGIPKFSSKFRFQFFIMSAPVKCRLFLRFGIREHFSWQGNLYFLRGRRQWPQASQSADPARGPAWGEG